MGLHGCLRKDRVQGELVSRKYCSRAPHYADRVLLWLNLVTCARPETQPRRFDFVLSENIGGVHVCCNCLIVLINIPHSMRAPTQHIPTPFASSLPRRRTRAFCSGVTSLSQGFAVVIMC